MILYESELFAEESGIVDPFKIVIEKEKTDGWESILVSRINFKSIDDMAIKSKELLTASGYNTAL